MATEIGRKIAAHAARTAERRAEFEELMERALRAGGEAAEAVPQAFRGGRGVAWVQLRSGSGAQAFGWFARTHHGDMWKHEGRRRGTYLAAEYACLGQGLAWAEAVCRVLGEGGVRATAEHQAVQPEG